MFLFPSALLLGGAFSISDYIVWNELPTVLGNMIGGITFTGLPLYFTHLKTASRRLDAPTGYVENEALPVSVSALPS
jgi:formate/nitrite transporter FocA (FNT family)